MKTKLKNFFKAHPKPVLFLAIAILLVLIVSVALLIYYFRHENGREGFFPQQQSMNLAITEDMVMASGVTNVGLVEETFDVEDLSTELEIEEIYVTSGSELKQGDKILKITDESIEEARAELEESLRDAQLAYRAGVIEYEQSLIVAEYERDIALLEGEQAQGVYEESLASLSNSLKEAEEKLNDAVKDVEEYMSYVLDESYEAYFGVDEYQEIYNENLELLESLMEEWGYTWTEVVGGTPNNMGGSQGTVSGSDAEDVNNYKSSSYSTLLSSLYKVLEDNLNNLEGAESDYADALINAKFELQILQLEMPELEQALAEAKQNMETKQLELKLTYETSLKNAESAESDYETAVEKAESDNDVLKNAWEDAKDNLELFESSLGDGYFYASEAGTVIRTMVRSGGNLTPDSTVVMYSNPSEMSVTVSVDQTNIAKVSVGDNAYVVSSSGDGVQGTVTSVNPVSYSDSRTNVTYEVTVVLSGETGNLSTNQSVTVILGLSEEDISALESQINGKMTEDTGNGEHSQDGMNNADEKDAPDGKKSHDGTDFDGMALPDGMEERQNMEMPEGRGGRTGKRDSAETDGGNRN